MPKVKIEILEDLNPTLKKGMIVDAESQPASGLVKRGKAKYYTEAKTVTRKKAK